MLYELGVLFKTDDLGEADYQKRAWQIFMTTCHPQQLAGCTIYAGEIQEVGMSHEEIYCIAVQTPGRQVIHYLKTVFMLGEAPGLLSIEQRFIERGVTLRYPLSIRGRIDAGGQFHSWQESFVRRDRQLCLDAGWEFGGALESVVDFLHGTEVVVTAADDEFSKVSIKTPVR